MGFGDASVLSGGSATPPTGQILLGAFVPSAVMYVIFLVLLKILNPFLAGRARRWAELRHFRADPACKHETTLTITPERVCFRCGEDCITQSRWNSYEKWVEKGHILLLVTHGQARRIVSVGQLSDESRDELRGILSGALPGKF